MLNFGGMLKTTIYDGTETFCFEDKIFESRGVDTDIMSSVFLKNRKKVIFDNGLNIDVEWLFFCIICILYVCDM